MKYFIVSSIRETLSQGPPHQDIATTGDHRRFNFGLIEVIKI